MIGYDYKKVAIHQPISSNITRRRLKWCGQVLRMRCFQNSQQCLKMDCCSEKESLETQNNMEKHNRKWDEKDRNDMKESKKRWKEKKAMFKFIKITGLLINYTT